MKVIQTVSGIGRESSGPSYSVPGLCRGLIAADVTVCLHTRMKKWTKPLPFDYVAYPYLRSRILPEHTPGMLEGLRKACEDADVLHSNGLWNMPSVYPVWAVRGTKCKLVVAPRGSLSEWALRKSYWRKKLFGWIFQYKVLRDADMLHATADAEYLDIRRLGYRQPVAVIPNGIDVEFASVNSGSVAKKRRVFFLSRIHPKKNLELLIKVWARIEDAFPDWSLSIVGPDKQNLYADQMKELAHKLNCKRVVFEGELIGNQKKHFMAESSCMILPTHSENFGMVVAESLACGTPVICSHGAPWEGLVSNNCGWWLPIEEEAFENAMREAMSMPMDKLTAMGKNGRDWMSRDYSWEGIGTKMKAAYEWLLGKGDRPEWVRLG